jgi:hypothetical protein
VQNRYATIVSQIIVWSVRNFNLQVLTLCSKIPPWMWGLANCTFQVLAFSLTSCSIYSYCYPSITCADCLDKSLHTALPGMAFDRTLPFVWILLEFDQALMHVHIIAAVLQNHVQPSESTFFNRLQACHCGVSRVSFHP